MEIDKVTFETLKNDKITSSFEELDIDADGKITAKDKTNATDKIATEIATLLELADDDSAVTNTKAGDTENAATNATKEELEAKLEKLNEDTTALDKEIVALEKENVALKEEKAKLEEEQTAKQAELEEINKQLEEEQDTLNHYIQEYSNIQAEVDVINKEILLEEKRETQQYENDMKKLAEKAIDEYDSEKDGDFTEYFNKKMDSMDFPVFSKLFSLNSQAANLSVTAKTVLQNISLQSEKIAGLKVKAKGISAEITALNADIKNKTDGINANNTKIKDKQTKINENTKEAEEVQEQMEKLVPDGELTGQEVLAQVSAEEKKIAKGLKWDLRNCMIAKGADGKFHIYNANGESAVRKKYGKKSPKGRKIIPSGSGYMKKISNAQAGQGRTVYTFTDVNADWSDGTVKATSKNYTTSSPLVFDVSGDGIKTTNNTISFDIDGDGKNDIVNNSSDWVLAFDKDHNGIAGENGSELFGDNTDLDGDGKKDGYKNGFAALKALAKKEGLMSKKDNVLDADDLKVLSEKYGLVMTKGYGGEAKSLSELGISQINLASTKKVKTENNFDGQNNDLMRQEGSTFVVDDKVFEYADVWNAKKLFNETDEEAAKNRLNLEEETYTEVSAEINEKEILKLNSENVIAIKGNIDTEKIKTGVKNEYKNKIQDEDINKDDKNKKID